MTAGGGWRKGMRERERIRRRPGRKQGSWLAVLLTVPLAVGVLLHYWTRLMDQGLLLSGLGGIALFFVLVGIGRTRSKDGGE